MLSHRQNPGHKLVITFPIFLQIWSERDSNLQIECPDFKEMFVQRQIFNTLLAVGFSYANFRNPQGNGIARALQRGDNVIYCSGTEIQPL